MGSEHEQESKRSINTTKQDPEVPLPDDLDQPILEQEAIIEETAQQLTVREKDVTGMFEIS